MEIWRKGPPSGGPLSGMLSLLVAIAALVLAIGACATPPPARAPVAIAVGSGTAKAPAEATVEYASEEDAAIPVNHDDPTFGSRLAPVTVVVFSDFQCPFCGRFAATLQQLREEYRPEDVRIVWKNEPLAFHQHARLAAEVGQGVYALGGTKAFWKFHDTAFRRQQVMSPEAIRAWAVDAGVDSGALEDGLTRKRWAQKVDYDVAVASKVGATGTPTSFINGVRLSGAQPYDKLKQMVEAQLEKGKALAASGTAKDLVYAKATRANYEAPKARNDDDDEDDDEPKTAKTVFKVPVAGSPVRGPATALVTIVVFSDFQCPYCKRVEPTLEQIRTTYGDKVRVVWKDEPLPFHPRARPAAELARFARSQKGDAGFWAVHDALFASQPKLEDADLEAVATAAGLDGKKAMASVNAKTHARAIDRDLDLGDDVQASGTPHFFVNGRRLVGAQPFDKFKPLIDEELVRAEAAVKSGVARAALYDHLIKDGKTGADPERRTVAAAAANAPFRGVANAKVTIQAFSDFQCPFCARVEPVLEELLKDYAGKIKIVWRDHPLPMHPDAPLAAEAAREAHAQKGNEGFAKMRALLFANPTALNRQALEGYAAQIGLDVARFGRALDGHVHKAAVDADAAAASAANASGTPSFFIGPYFLSGAQPITKFRKLVELTLNPPPTPPPAPTAALPAGLVVKDVVVGKGPAVKAGDKLKVEYTGTLTNGTQFDSSRGRQPFTFTIGNGQVIKGWEQGLLGMKVGGTRKLTIPPALGYGSRGAGAAIPPDATLLFDVELVAIEP